MTPLRYRSALCLAATAFAIGCGGSGTNDASQRPSRAPVMKVGFLLDNTHERWERDRRLFVEAVEQQGAEVVVEIADGDQQRQIEQADRLLNDGANVLVVVPHDASGAAPIVERARAKNVPVISYDRLIRDADVDLYITFDNVKVGQLQAQALLARVPKGNYVLIGGPKTDFNAVQFREGQMKALQPAIDAKDIRIVFDEWAAEWTAEAAAALTTQALDKARNRVDAIVAPNDVTAGGAVGVLEERKLAGKVAVSGQDAELDAVRRVVQGTQAMTVYKPIRALTRLASVWAVRMAGGTKAEGATTVNNGLKDVPTMMVDPIAITDANIAVLINDGYHTKEQIDGGSDR